MVTNIKVIAREFENKTLPKEQWTHSAHIAVAFVYLDKYKNLGKALSKLRDHIKEYNISVGTENNDNSGYHETLTVFWLKVVSEFCETENQADINELFNNFSKTILASSKLPTKFYSKELLFSKTARQIWTDPNLLPISEIRNLIMKKMEQHFILSDSEFEEQFADASLNPIIFTHEAHLRLAWIHLLKYGETKAIENIKEQLKNYVRHIGATDKYNETLTVAAIKTIKHFMQKHPFDTFYDFINNVPRLKTNFRNIIEQHYGFDIFNSEIAKEKYLEPDLLQFT